MDHSRVEQQPITSGLTRYRSAPSSYFSTLLTTTTPVTGGGCGYARDDFSNLPNSTASSSSTDIEQVFTRFVASIGNSNSNSGNFPTNQPIHENPTSNMNVRSDFVVPKQEITPRLVRHRSSDYSLISNYQNENQHFISPVKKEPETLLLSTDHISASQLNYQSQPQQIEKLNAVTDKPFVFANSASLTPGSSSGGGGNSNLTRYNSSPAGFFAQINIENEYGAIRGIGSYKTGTNAAAETSLSTQKSFKTQVGFSSGKPPASPRLMAPISEFGTKVLEEKSTGNEHKNDEHCITDFPMPSWEDSHILSDDFLKTEDIEIEPFSNEDASHNQSSEGLARPPIPLSHHLSLPTSTMEKLLQDSVHLNVRAKRGCATHPRSIAERVRRTRISDRMRKLQELVPNMDKQTNTADMLDFAVDYIKELEKQVKILAERRAKCTCINK
ncbi:hypothetical protein EJD97_022052 [Solanum chilense]|uniref:BHLH domain-containing protein n=1 Tax=Solanum chilense TaxID=4083 RepID=A0A6N2AU86_SOLCI|nr:hypothetical protein EJD97_022052 [Solanum chilense]